MLVMELFAPWESAFGYGPFEPLDWLAARGYRFLFACPQGLVPHHGRKVMEISPSSSQAYEMLARLYVEQKQLDLALTQFEEVLKRDPKSVAANTMMIVAAVALVLNLGIAWALGGHGDHHHDLNVRAAWLHMAGDAASSAAIIAGALLIRYTGWQAIDRFSRF
jgi:hypothetical protein